MEYWIKTDLKQSLAFSYIHTLDWVINIQKVFRFVLYSQFTRVGLFPFVICVIRKDKIQFFVKFHGCHLIQSFRKIWHENWSLIHVDLDHLTEGGYAWIFDINMGNLEVVSASFII